MIVSLQTAAGAILPRVTRCPAKVLAVTEGVRPWPVIKTVAIAPADVGGRQG